MTIIFHDNIKFKEGFAMVRLYMGSLLLGKSGVKYLKGMFR